MKWIGLTGGIASGKSTVAKILREQGYPVVDADILAREAVKPNSSGYQEVLSQFGNEILNPQGEIDRQKLGQIVFSDLEKLSQLEAIIHPIVRGLQNKKRHELDQKGVEYAFYDVPLLFEKNLNDQFDHVVVVFGSRAHQVERMKDRDGLSLEEIEDRLKSQIPLEEKKLKADFVVNNEGDLSDLKKEVLRVLREIKTEA